MTQQAGQAVPGDPWNRTPAELVALRRKQLIIGGVLGGVVVLGVVLAVVFSVVLNKPSTDPTSPEQAAQKWVSAVLTHNSGQQKHLECVGANHSAADVLKLVAASSADVRAETARPDGAHHWQVPVSAAGTVVTVGVEEQGNRYLVC